MRTLTTKSLVFLLLVGILATAWGLHAAAEKSKEPTLKDMKKLLKQAIVGADEGALVATMKRLGRVNGRPPVRAILEVANSLPKNDETYYWVLLEGAASFKQPLAFSELGDYIVQYRKRPIARDVLHALSKNRSKYMNRVIRRTLGDNVPKDLQLMAVDLAGSIPVRRTVDVLLEVYQREDARSKPGKPTELKTRLVFALEGLTRHRFGDSLPNWIGWWEANREKGLKVIRDEAENSNASTGLVQPLDPVREREFFGLEEIQGKVLVIKGAIARNGVDTNFDHMEEVLERIGVKPDVWEKSRLESDDCPSLDRYAAIFINCTQINRFCQTPGHQGGNAVGNRLRRCLGPAPHDEFHGKMKDAALQRLRKFVEKGGQLFTEDWALIEVIEMLWPEMLSRGDKLTEGNVRIRANRGQTSHPLLRGVFVPPVKLDEFDWDEVAELDEFGDEIEKEDEVAYDPTAEDDPGDTDDDSGLTGMGGDATPAPEDIEDIEIDLIEHKWKIDNESPAISVNSKKVQVLISSDDLKAECGDPAVAVTFPIKRGRVVHVLSHFGKQDSRRDEATLENFLVNFLLEVHVQIKRNKKRK